VPVPDGFELAPPQAKQFRGILEGQMGTNAQALLVLVSHEDAERFRKTNAFSCQRSLILGAARGSLEKIATEDQFVRLKDAMISWQAEMGNYVRAHSQNVATNVSEAVKHHFDVNAGVTVGDATFYPVHAQSARCRAHSFSFSAALSMTNPMVNPASQQLRTTNALTQCYVYCRPHILLLVATGGEDDLAWSRQVVKEWTAQVIMANP